MRTTMSEQPLSVVTILERAERHHGHKVITTAVGSARERIGYAGWAGRVRRVVSVLDGLGVSAGGRVATFGSSTARHLEVYYAAPCSGRVIHALNPRLEADELSYLMNHSSDEVVFADRALLPRLVPALATASSVKHLVLFDGAEPGDPEIGDLGWIDVHGYDSLVDSAPTGELSIVDERNAAAVCYTSGTTGNPKAVVYSHRSIVLQQMSLMARDSIGIGEDDVVMPVVPMFHANTWGLVHAPLATGAALVLPGADLSGPALAELIVQERVTVTAGVPTIWTAVLPNLSGRDASSLRVVMTGGAPVPTALSEGYRRTTGVALTNAWGMTETSASGPVSTLRREERTRSEQEQARLRTSAGRTTFGIDARIADDAGKVLPWDGKSTGELQCRGPWVTTGYYNDPRGRDGFTADGWLRTGDVATIDPDGRVWLVDRAKDMIKSGGEWIGSAEIENELLTHPQISEAAVIGVASATWSERPLACVVLKPGATADADELSSFLGESLPKWKIPDRIVFVDEIPRTNVGKYSKRELREMFAGVVLP
ncbi:long-chain-fatty-acid--CoA ligase [Amycolatopsis sp. RM579]|uniref:Long-chain-fatty-acid--CoA ligase n=2 Tax=Amycolatopsis pithecellobii TaxID=664692 RepID=A0A6N7YLI1_9PSEU|nr:long-chain-fatty-acid--CoA ligase [Amycolatopsis pithecellobii]